MANLIRRTSIAAVLLAACAHSAPKPPPPPQQPRPDPIGTADHSYRAVTPRQLGRPLVGEFPHLPDRVLIREKGNTVAWNGMIYVEPDGAVSRVDIVNPIPGADGAIVTCLRTWRFAPSGERRRTLAHLLFRVR